MKRENVIIEKETAWEVCGEGLRRQIMGFDERLMLVKIHFDKGATGALHKHSHSQSSFIVSGKFEATIGETKITLTAGDGYYVEPDLIHGIRCIEEGILIDTFAPYREDFLK